MRAIVIGNATLDITYEVEALPRSGETVLAHRSHMNLGGKGANQAVIMRRAGLAVRLLAAIGRDPEAAMIAGMLADEGLDPASLASVDSRSDQSIVTVAASGENTIVSTADAARAITPATAIAALAQATPGDLLVMQGNLRFETTLAACREARTRELKIVVNPAPVTFSCQELWPLVDLAIVNAVEAAELGGAADPTEAARNIRSWGAIRVAVTLGAEGALLADGNGELRVAAPRVQAVDSTGAGDVFSAIAAAVVAATGALDQRGIAAAVEAASISVTRRGALAGFPSRDEIAAILMMHFGREVIRSAV